jgi:hypothetical protein
MAFRPRPRASAISSRYGSQALALGARAGEEGRLGSVDTSSEMAGFDRPESVDTSGVVAGFARPGSVDTPAEIAGFDFASLGRPRLRTAMPAAFR